MTSKHSTATAHKTSHHSSASKSHLQHAHSSSHHASTTHHDRSSFHSAALDSDPHLGTASLYSTRHHGRKTASGEKYDMYAMTAAHKTLPLKSYVEVTNLKNNRTVVVRINDRGPFHGNRVMDLSTAAAEELGIDGLGSVKITPLAMN
ncbi:MAG: septal ring lytic transglycosylase RlpA family protein [Methylococcales bacterium]|nr:septal ring lytic transglycosylase RlpA family protein [Methylococcales bacterium]